MTKFPEGVQREDKDDVPSSSNQVPEQSGVSSDPDSSPDDTTLVFLDPEAQRRTVLVKRIRQLLESCKADEIDLTGLAD